MVTITVAATGVVASLATIALVYLGLRSYRPSQAQNPRTYKKGRL